MKNKLTDLQNHLFAMIEKLNNDDLTGEELDEEIKRSMSINELARTAVSNGALMAKCVDLLYGVPVSDDVPLIPKAKDETFFVSGKKTALIPAPKTRDDGTSGYKRGGSRQAI